MLQIIGGQYRTRRLQTPPDASTSRPYSQRVKESVFNILRGHWEGARVLDLFAGVGTMGLEAISRGAAEVLMVEQDRRIYALLEKNVQELGCEATADILRGDALGSVSLLRAPRPLDVVFVDPPFVMMRDEAGRARVLDHIARAAALLASDGMIVLRTPMDANEISHAIAPLRGPEIREYRRHHQVLLYARGEATP
jgi:16S rRNA (guanine(966)-N(2))-methyltransferase RsmD